MIMHRYTGTGHGLAQRTAEITARVAGSQEKPGYMMLYTSRETEKHNFETEKQ
jgi:hypothetical protein